MKNTIKIKFAALGTHRDYYDRRPCGSARETLNASPPPPPRDVQAVECVRVRAVARASVYVPALHASHRQLPLPLNYPSVQIYPRRPPQPDDGGAVCAFVRQRCALVCVCVRSRVATSRWPRSRPLSGRTRASATPPVGQSPWPRAVIHRRRACRSSHTGSRSRTTRTPIARGMPAVDVADAHRSALTTIGQK